mmetsp:Transcript_36341/g.75964  ORF Transcript_36341/g.75964 Transcript_36341/m.75964 type:complete len:129 (-) Transcript_36341:272-658(-)
MNSPSVLAVVLACSCVVLSSFLYAGIRTPPSSEIESFVVYYPTPIMNLKRNTQLRDTMLSGQIDFLQYRNMCLVACRSSLAEENPSESSVHCRSDTLTPRWLEYIRSCELDPRKCEIRAMGCRGWILA